MVVPVKFESQIIGLIVRVVSDRYSIIFIWSRMGGYCDAKSRVQERRESIGVAAYHSILGVLVRDRYFTEKDIQVGEAEGEKTKKSRKKSQIPCAAPHCFFTQNLPERSRGEGSRKGLRANDLG